MAYKIIWLGNWYISGYDLLCVGVVRCCVVWLQMAHLITWFGSQLLQVEMAPQSMASTIEADPNLDFGTSSDWFLQFFLLKLFHSKTTLHLAGTNPPCNHSGVSCARYISASNWESTAYYGNLRNFIYVYVFNSFVLIYMYVFNPPPITSPKQTFKLHIACVCISFTTNRNTTVSEAHIEFYMCEFVYFLYLNPTQSRQSFIFSICGCMYMYNINWIYVYAHFICILVQDKCVWSSKVYIKYTSMYVYV